MQNPVAHTAGAARANRSFDAAWLAVLFLGLTLYSSEAVAQVERPGSATADFLRIGVHPRAAAMGDAYVGIANGAEAAFYNPAALARIASTAISVSHTDMYAGINHDFFAAAHHFRGGWGAFGVSVTALHTDAMAVRTPLQPGGTGETFRVVNTRAGLAHARQLTDRVSFGGSLHYIDMSLASGFRARAVAMDIAALYVTGVRGFRFGMMISNFGSDVTFVKEGYPLPTRFAFGMGAHAIERARSLLTVSGAAAKPNDGKPLLQMGAEWQYAESLFLRAGYQPNHDTASFSFGGGVGLRWAGSSARMHYSWNDFGLLGPVHRVGMDLTF